MSLDKINKRSVSDFYQHRNRYMINDINKIVAFYRIGDKGEKEPIDLIRLNFLLTSKNVTPNRILVMKRNITIIEKYSCGLDVFGYKAIESDFFGNKIKHVYNNFIPNISPNKKQFPAIYYRWESTDSTSHVNKGFVDIRYLLGVINTNRVLFKETLNLFDKENLLLKLN